MFISENQNKFPQNSDLSSLKPRKRSKEPCQPHLPPDLLGQRYVKFFWHPFNAIVSPLPDKQEFPPQELTLAKAQAQPLNNKPSSAPKPKWRTIDYYLHPSQLWRLHQDKKQLVGIRFNSTTQYAIIDIDEGGRYHKNSSESINRIKSALENIGIVSIVPIQSSWSGGYHLILVFEEKLPTFKLACALEKTLKTAGFIPQPGHLEIFPNVKSYSNTEIINYNAIRCPMQPGSGALLLDDDLQPISDDVSIFLDHCKHAARRQDLTKLKKACEKARKNHKPKYPKQTTTKVDAWRNHWETIIATGWTASGQTNTLLPIFIGYGIVFQGLEGSDLVEYVVSTATSAPGYSQYCQHQYEIEARVRDWVECTTKHQWYTPYASNPERPLKTYSRTYAEVIAGIKPNHQPLDNIIPIDRRRQQSIERSQQAQQRITKAVKAIERETGLSAQIKARAQQIRSECQQQFKQSPSLEILYKNLNLWHPDWYIEDPWTENSSNLDQMEGYGYLDQKSSCEPKQKPQKPHQMEGYGYSPLMKVLKSSSAATAPQGLEAAVSFTQQPQLDEQSTAQQPAEPEILNPETENSSKTASNCNNESNDSLASLNNFSLNQNSSDKNSKYFFGPGTDSNCHKHSLLDNPNGVLDAASTPLSVPSRAESMDFLRVNTGFTADSTNILELKQIAYWRPKAVVDARKVVRQYCLMTQRVLTCEERLRLEQTAKMQFYLDSPCPVLVAEAETWSKENPGCLPFSLLSAFEDGDEFCDL